MKKKNWLTILIVGGFLLLAGTLYTISYIRPWKKEAILLNGNQTTEAIDDTATDSAQSSMKAIAEETTPNDTKEKVIPAVERSLNDQQESKIIVHICGAVKNPGVYEVCDGTRLNDIVLAAGGLSKKAAAEYVNLAQTVTDGQKYYIPFLSDVEGMNQLDSMDGFHAAAKNADAGAADGSRQNQDGPASNKSGLININTATRDELMSLPGVGETKADAVIAYRETVSQYEAAEDIKKVNGIKEGLFQKIKDLITVK